MAVVELRANPNAVQGTNKSTNTVDALYVGGKKLKIMYAKVSKGASDSALSIYRMFENVPCNVKLISLSIANGALGAGAQWNVGLFQSGIGGAIVDVDVFAALLDLSAARTSFTQGAAPLAANGLAALTIDLFGKSLWEHAGATEANKKATYDICLQPPVTPGANAATIAAMLMFAEE